MVQHKQCSQCGDKSSCREVLQLLGNSEQPPVIGQALVAFVLPIVVFMGVLATAQQLLEKQIESVPLRTIVALLPAIGAAVLCVAVARMLGNRSGKS